MKTFLSDIKWTVNSLIKMRFRKIPSVEKAFNWLCKFKEPEKKHFHKSAKQFYLTLDTSAHLIETLYQYGEKNFAQKLVKWQSSMQYEDGAFVSNNKNFSIFNTAEICNGFLTVLDEMPYLKTVLRNACSYIEKNMNAENYSDFSHSCMQYLKIYISSVLMKAGKALNEEKFILCAKNFLKEFKHNQNLIIFNPEFKSCPYYVGFILQALIDLGEFDWARNSLKRIISEQEKKGYIPAFPGADWMCPALSGQLAISMYRLGFKKEGDKVLSSLEKNQNKKGCFYGNYGKGAFYSQKENVLGVKFFLDACLYKIKTDFDQNFNYALEYLSEEDGRIRELLSYFGDINGKKIVDVGCGKGRYLRIIESRFPKAQLYATDISTNFLSLCPKKVHVKEGSLLNINYPDNFFDCVYCIEALEHVLFTSNAVRELTRILKPGGKILIIDKNAYRLGVLKLMPWEKWFKPREIKKELKKNKVYSEFNFIDGGKYLRRDKLFIAWKGVKINLRESPKPVKNREFKLQKKIHQKQPEFA